MAQIREELILVDKFTAAFTSYLQNTGRAAEATELAKKKATEYTQAQQKLGSSTDGLTSKIRNLVGAYVGLRSVSALVNLADTYTQTTARLDMMNDGLQTTADLNQMIYESAQRSRGAYQGTAYMVAKLGTLAGDAFSSSAEVVAFAEQINKQMTLSGASSVGRDAAMLQLTQAMSSGVLRGEELNSILEQTPTIAQSIAEYMGVSVGEMREMASEGQITADVVKNAMFASAEETNAKFEQMPMTWGQVWASFQNTAIMALQPVLSGINILANNIKIIGPMVLGLGGAFAVFQIAANWTKIAEAAAGAYHFVVNLLTIGFGVLTGNAAAASAAVFTFNSAALASPVTWVAMGVMLLVGALYAGVAAFNALTGSSISATGIITGVIAAGAAFIGNVVIGLVNGALQAVQAFVSPFISIVEWILNAANGGFDSFGGAVANLIGNIISWFLDLGEVVTKIIDAIFGTDWTSGLESLKSSVTEWGKNENAITIDRTAPTLDRISYSDAFSAGYDWGSNLFSSSTVGVPSYDQMTGLTKSVGNIEKTVSMSEEDLKSLVDVAERQYVNKINVTAQTPVITINGQNTGNTAADRQNLADTIRDILVEQVASGSTRSTARAY